MPHLSDCIIAARKVAAELDEMCVRAIKTEGFDVAIEAEVMITATGLDVTIFFTDRAVRKLNRENLEAELESVVRTAIGRYLPASMKATDIDVGFLENFSEEDLMDQDSAPAGATVHPSFQPFDAEDSADPTTDS